MTSDDGDQVDWFGYSVRDTADLRPVPVVPCPRCGQPFDSGGGLRTHLVQVHGERAARTRSSPHQPGRVRRWVRGLAYLPFWFVVPLNLGVSALLAVAWWDEIALFSFGDQTGVIKTWIMRLSLLPVTCYLAARVATVRRD